MLLFLILFSAAQAGELDEKPVLNKRAAKKETPCPILDIHAALKRSDEKACLKLALERMDVNEVDRNGDTPLHAAIRLRRVQAFFQLVRAGADLNARNDQQQTPRELAESLGYRRAADLLAHGEFETERLLRAIEFNDLLAAHNALLRGASMGTTDLRRDTPLHRAAQSGFTEIGLLLLKRGARVNARNYLGETPLHAAALREHTEFMAMLLSNSANANAIDQRRQTPLDLVEGRGTPATFTLLKKYGAKNGSAAHSSLDTSIGDGEGFLAGAN
jgi:ankyrin repeat protein